jgi:hypothetical protein
MYNPQRQDKYVGGEASTKTKLTEVFSINLTVSLSTGPLNF